MLNQCSLVGRVKELPQVKQTSTGTSLVHLLLEVDRSFRNSDGTLGSDIFQIVLWKGVADSCKDLCDVGSVLAIKGRLQANVYESNGKTYYNTEMVAEKVSFISHRLNQN